MRGKGNGKGSGKKQAPSGEGRDFGFSMGVSGGGAPPGMMTSVTKLAAAVAKRETKINKFGAPAKTDKKKEDTWTCLQCRCEKCYVSSTHCFKCGEPRVPEPPGFENGQPAAPLPSQAEASLAAPMEVEVKECVEDWISEQEEILKFFKNKETTFAKAEKLAAEGRLKELKERQRQARSLPARLQAATDRLTQAQR